MKLLVALVLTFALPAAADAPHGPWGPLRPPLQAPALTLVGADGRPVELRTRLRGKVTALHLMFTACTATCPIQGALFAELQKKLDAVGPDAQLVSISIDAQGDTPDRVSAWLKRYGASARWTAAIPKTNADADALLDFFRGRADGADRHSAQTYVIDRSGQLAYRSETMPSATGLVEAMKHIAATLP